MLAFVIACQRDPPVQSQQDRTAPLATADVMGIA